MVPPPHLAADGVSLPGPRFLVGAVRLISDKPQLAPAVSESGRKLLGSQVGGHLVAVWRASGRALGLVLPLLSWVGGVTSSSASSGRSRSRTEQGFSGWAARNSGHCSPTWS